MIDLENVTNLDELNVTDSNYCLITGFFWIEFDNNKYLQCSLKSRKNGKGYCRQIAKDDSGFDERLCKDENSWALDAYDAQKVKWFILSKAKKMGIEIV